MHGEGPSEIGSVGSRYRPGPSINVVALRPADASTMPAVIVLVWSVPTVMELFRNSCPA